jgi:DNA mismatch endonuclease, patch repair protein
VEVHGCFWHAHPNCKYAAVPKSNAAFWRQKIDANVRRDSLNRRALKLLGWRVEVIWECQLQESKLLRLVKRIRA